MVESPNSIRVESSGSFDVVVESPTLSSIGISIVEDEAFGCDVSFSAKQNKNILTTLNPWRRESAFATFILFRRKTTLEHRSFKKTMGTVISVEKRSSR